MFGWESKPPECPIADNEQSWLDSRFAWLTETLGVDRLLAATQVLPTEDYFPESYAPSEEQINFLMAKVAGYMGVDSETLELGFYDESTPRFEGVIREGSAGAYTEADGKYQVWLEVSKLEEPLGVVATLTHEIGHVVLLGGGLVSSDEPDHEPLTDLLTVFLGMGVLTANNVIQESNWNHGNWSQWGLAQSGYLTMPMYGYALALFAHARSEPSAEWVRFLRPDVRSPYKKSIAYLKGRET